MAVVAPVFSEGFLDYGTPESTVIAQIGEDSLLLGGVLPGLFQGQVVVNDDGVLLAESVELESVDASLVQLVVLVEEDSIHAAGLFSDGRDGGEEPAVAEATLVDIVRRDAITEQRFVGESRLSARPLNAVIA